MRALHPTDLLDPRAKPVPSIASSVWIAAEELSDRVFELAPKGTPVRVAHVDGAEFVMPWLSKSGRPAALTDDFTYGPSGGCRLWSPNEFVEEVAPLLPPGRALDLGCGTGRDAVYLASLGWEVTAVDHLPDALERARQLEAKYLPNMGVDWVQGDLDENLTPLGAEFDIITMFFHYDLNLVSRALHLLSPGGTILIESFSQRHRGSLGRPKEARRAIGDDLKSVLDGLEVKSWSSGMHGDRHTVRVWATRARG